MTQYWFITNKNRKKSRLALVTLLLAFIVLILGCYTRLTDAGLSCPDWPNCYGFITAPHTEAQLADAIKHYPLAPVNVKKAWTEMTHRYLAGVEGILILLLSFSIFLGRKNSLTLLKPNKDKKSTLIASGLILLLGVQIILGMLTVTAQLKPIIVLAHLLTGVSILTLLWFFYFDLNFPKHLSRGETPSSWLPGIGVIIIFLQIALGGWVAANYAGLSCVDFPYCNGQLLPDMKWHLIGSDLITIHMLHRIGACITATYVAFLGLKLWHSLEFRAIGILLLAFVSLQILLGILNIIWLRPTWIALAHYITAILLLEIMITLFIKTIRLNPSYSYA